MFILNVQISDAQITITDADMPNIGDTLRYSVPLPVSVVGYDFIQTGANHTWNYSNLMHASQDIDTFVSVTSAPIFYYPSFVGKATIAHKGESVSMASFSLTNVYDFFKETTSYFAQVGFAAQFNGIPLPTVYSSPDYIYRFPLTYGDVDSCEFTYNITVPTLFSYSSESARHNTVDGWGMLTTPFGTFQTIRIKSVVTSRDSVASDSLPFPIPPMTNVTTEYKWLANGYRSPLLTVITRNVGQPEITYLDHYRPNTGIKEKTGDVIALKPVVYPNPSEGIVYVELSSTGNASMVHYSVLDSSGRILLAGTETNKSDSFIINLSELQSGLYFLILQSVEGGTGMVKLIRN